MSLEALLTYCRENGIHGSYRCVREEGGWRARIRAGMRGGNGLAETREAALDRIAKSVLDDLTRPESDGGWGDPYGGIY
jgi:hypothetical protein